LLRLGARLRAVPARCGLGRFLGPRLGLRLRRGRGAAARPGPLTGLQPSFDVLACERLADGHPEQGAGAATQQALLAVLQLTARHQMMTSAAASPVGRTTFAPYRCRPFTMSAKPFSLRVASVLLICSA